jgi:predicted alpha/beta-hydrolase family hydrolase
MNFLLAGPEDAPVRLLLAHGAGAAMDSSFMTLTADLLARRGVATARFEFAYMATRRNGGKKRPPPRGDLLQPEYDAAIAAAQEAWPSARLAIGGKSLGGRVASLVADRAHEHGEITALVCLGYPFHPPGKPDELRTAHLLELRCPTLIVQGERDPFGTRAEVEALKLSPSIAFHWAGDGDHDLGPRGGQGFTRRGNLEAAADAVAAFLSAPAA